VQKRYKHRQKFFDLPSSTFSSLAKFFLEYDRNGNLRGYDGAEVTTFCDYT